jgi:hypothetical protein
MNCLAQIFVVRWLLLCWDDPQCWTFIVSVDQARSVISAPERLQHLRNLKVSDKVKYGWLIGTAYPNVFGMCFHVCRCEGRDITVYTRFGMKLKPLSWGPWFCEQCAYLFESPCPSTSHIKINAIRSWRLVVVIYIIRNTMFVSCYITSNKTILGLDIINSYLCSYITTVKFLNKHHVLWKRDELFDFAADCQRDRFSARSHDHPSGYRFELQNSVGPCLASSRRMVIRSTREISMWGSYLCVESRTCEHF